MENTVLLSISLSLFTAGIFIIFYYALYDKHKDKIKSKVSKEIQLIKKEELSKITGNFKKPNLLGPKVVLIILQVIITVFILIYFYRVAKVWYMKIGIVMLSIASPYFIYGLFNGKRKDKLTEALPEMLRTFTAQVEYENNIVEAIKSSSQKSGYEKLSKMLKNLGERIEKNEIEEGLTEFYISSNENIFIYQFCMLIGLYIEKGNKQYIIQLKRMSSNIESYLATKKQKKSAIAFSKILAFAATIAVPLSVKFVDKITLGYASGWFYSITGQNTLGIVLLYNITVLILISVLERF